MIVPRFTQERCLILSDSDVESLLAVSMASEQQSLTPNEASVVIPAWWGITDEDLDLLISAIDPACSKQAALLGLRCENVHALYPPEDERVDKSGLGQLQTRLLTEAAYLAARSGIKRVIWPVRVASDSIDRVAEIGSAIDRALLISRLVTLDSTTETAPEVVIETPFVDLTDNQVQDLARDMAVPIDTCWWAQGKTLEIAQPYRVRWAELLTKSQRQIEPKPNTQTPA